jgi:hypothetical protein
MVLQEPYNTKPESISTVIDELTKLQQLGNSHTYSVYKSCDEAGNIKLLIEITPVSE